MGDTTKEKKMKKNINNHQHVRTTVFFVFICSLFPSGLIRNQSVSSGNSPEDTVVLELGPYSYVNLGNWACQLGDVEELSP